jgi:hypothetical protein
MKYFFRVFSLIALCLSFSGCSKTEKPASNNSKTFYAHLSVRNERHKLFQPGDKDVPHPVPFYADMADEPVYPYKDACGYGTFLFDPERDELHYAIAYSSLSGDAIMMHFHLGGANTDGPIVQTIFGEPCGDVKGLGNSPEPPLSGKVGPKSRAGFVSGVYKLKGNADLKPPLSLEEERAMLMNGEIYVNIHTYLNEAGEIRGQLLPCEE